MRPDGPRDPVAGPDSGPEPPFPIKLSGPVIRGFGRGSKELGIPTANIPPDQLDQYPNLPTGVYYGFVGILLPPKTTPNSTPPSIFGSSSPSPSSSSSSSSARTTITTTKSSSTHPAVLSIGYNPFYANTTRSIEIHVLSPSLPPDFYGAPLNLLVLGFVRPEYDYISRESLVEDILTDCEVAKRSLAREAYRVFESGEWGEWLKGFEWAGTLESGSSEGGGVKLEG